MMAFSVLPGLRSRPARSIRICGLADSDPYKDKLTEEEYRVARLGGTEKAFTGSLWNEKRSGSYNCKCCGSVLFSSEDKFDSGTGWPSFTAPVVEEAVTDKLDLSHHMFRIEILCSKCQAHLGHHFPDKTKTGLRYCVNSITMTFEPDEEADQEESESN
mmetsp:Transcript_7819/g.34820  ORF Transcript_7819/g.34820 Transcript_7819/m.34820 type:complete len:159 (-) Transcript_7819:2658-3134(-)